MRVGRDTTPPAAPTRCPSSSRPRPGAPTTSQAAPSALLGPGPESCAHLSRGAQRCGAHEPAAPLCYDVQVSAFQGGQVCVALLAGIVSLHAADAPPAAGRGAEEAPTFAARPTPILQWP